jgi:hypothetical protein
MERWMLGALLTIAVLLAGAWASAIHSQLAEIKGAVTLIATTQSGFSTEVAILKMRLERLEKPPR